MIYTNRITQNPAVMGDKACIRGMRVTVSMILGQLASGRTVRDILDDYPFLEKEDILQDLEYRHGLRTEVGWTPGNFRYEPFILWDKNRRKFIVHQRTDKAYKIFQFYGYICGYFFFKTQ